jgi:hypothetical protein
MPSDERIPPGEEFGKGSGSGLFSRTEKNV